VKTPEQSKILQRIENENVKQVRDMWLDHFLEKVTCPVCNRPLIHLNRKIRCEQNHFETEY
jgi:DNA repair exonuclease SbcCD ATPase subunit